MMRDDSTTPNQGLLPLHEFDAGRGGVHSMAEVLCELWHHRRRVTPDGEVCFLALCEMTESLQPSV